MKIEIINKNEFNKYKDSIDRIHMENAYPNGYLIDDDYLTKADKIVLAIIKSRVVGYASLSKEDTTYDNECSFTITLSPNNIKIKQIAITKSYDDGKINTRAKDFYDVYQLHGGSYDLDKFSYYFEKMVREVGGIATGAYVDGRNTAYAKNEHYNSNQGIECYQIEMGYIDTDLQKIVEEEEDYAYAIADAIAEAWK